MEFIIKQDLKILKNELSCVCRRTLNMKKQAFAETAAKLYTEKFMTLESIAKQLNVNERTLRRWKAADNWRNKRLEYIKSKMTFHEDLYNFGRALLETIKTDLANGERVEPSRLHTVTKIMTLLKNVKTYEGKFLNDKHAPKKTQHREISPETIREIEEKILGITYEG